MYASRARIVVATHRDAAPTHHNASARWRFRGLLALLFALLCLLTMDASAGDRKTRNGLISAGLGAAGGALLSHGDPWATLGGAAAGGLIGAVVTNGHHHDRDRGRYDHGYRDYGRGGRHGDRGRWGH